MSDILALACEPGGANVVKSLVRPLRTAGFTVELWGRGRALQIFADADLRCEIVAADDQVVTPGIVRAILEDRCPRLLLSGTSGGDFTERFFWTECREMSIPTVAILDHWVNYGLRFSAYSYREIALQRLDRSLPYLPDCVCVMDQLALEEMLEDGVPRQCIEITGQPFLESLVAETAALGNPLELREKLGIKPGSRLVLFASEPLEQSYGSSQSLGFTEKTILSELLTCLESFDAEDLERMTLVIKLHPREDPGRLDPILSERAPRNLTIMVETAGNGRSLLAAADVVVGMASTLLVEAAILGKPVVSVQIGGKGPNPLVLCRSGFLESIHSRVKLREELVRTFSQTRPQGRRFGSTESAVHAITKLIRQKIARETMPKTTDSDTLLALHGGQKVRDDKFPASITIGQEEHLAARRVLDSGVLSRFLGVWHEDFMGGPEVQAFEKEWAAHFGAKHAVAVNSATSGLYAAVGAAGIEPGDEVIVSPYTMSASAVAPLVYSAIPVFADIEPEYFCLDADSVRAAITPRTKAIIVVDIFGLPYDATALNAIAKEHGLTVIEDNAQAPNALYKGKSAGTLGDIGIFSLNYHKHIHTGEGGMLVTDDDELAEKLRLIRNHAESVVLKKGNPNIANMVGFNYRMTELEAAIGREQLKKLGPLVRQRQDNVLYLSEKLARIPGITPAPTRPGATHVYYQHPLLFDSGVAGVHRDTFVKALQAELPLTELRETEGVKVGAGYVLPIYLQPLFQQRIAFGSKGHPWTTFDSSVRYDEGLCPVVEAMYKDRLITHDMMRPPLSRTDLDDVARAFEKVWNQRHRLEQLNS